MQAPSFGLDDYLKKVQQGTTSSNPQLAANMHAAFTSLQETVEAARQELESMQQLADECADAALAAPLPEVQQVTSGKHG
jgi:hypothetical protein